MAARASGYQLVLQYVRVGENSTGCINLSGMSVADVPMPVMSFENESFYRVLNHLARAISSYPAAQVIFVRTDYPHLKPFVLDQETVDLFLSDPVAAIQSMTFIAQAPEPKSGVAITPMFRAGYDTLAESFGDEVFILVRRGGIDCPGCGKWSMFRKEEENTARFSCRNCPPHVTATPIMLRLCGRWAAMSTTMLLSLPLDRFYLPCAWHEGLWITRQSLDELYKAYLAEKESTCFSRPLPVPPAS